MKTPEHCKIDGCDRETVARGWCDAHYRRWRKHGDPGAATPIHRLGEPPTCAVEGCDRSARARGYCNAHYKRWQTDGDPGEAAIQSYSPLPPACIVDGCDRPPRTRGWCDMHRARWMRHGDVHHKGRNSPGDGRAAFLNAHGYRMVSAPGHPNANQRGSIAEHRLVMSEYLGRPLRPEEVVHHRNGVRTDNRIENLELWTRSHPDGQRVQDIYDWARQIIETYGPEMQRIRPDHSEPEPMSASALLR